MTVRQICNVVYAIAAEGRDDKELGALDSTLLAPLNPRQLAAERALAAEFNRRRGG
jgi:hypothetical protein